MIKLKREKIGNVVIYKSRLYLIYDNNKNVGEIEYKKINKKLIICSLVIYENYQNKGYAKKTIEYLLNTHKIDCIIGETLESSRGFWHKMIIEFNGCRKNITYCNNCTSSFIIPKQNISCNEVYNLLKSANKY